MHKERLKYALKWMQFTRDFAKDAYDLIDEYRDLKEKLKKSNKAQEDAIDKEINDVKEKSRKDAKDADTKKREDKIKDDLKSWKDSQNPAPTDEQVKEKEKQIAEDYDTNFNTNFDAKYTNISREEALENVKKAEQNEWNNRNEKTRKVLSGDTFQAIMSDAKKIITRGDIWA